MITASTDDAVLLVTLSVEPGDSFGRRLERSKDLCLVLTDQIAIGSR